MGLRLICSILLLSAAAGAQQTLSDKKPFRSGIDVTTIAATVTDADGKLIAGLERDAFDVFEDGVRQPITQFTNERVSLSLGVLLDTSDSMFGRRIQDARSAVDRFLFDLLSPTDEFFILAFNHKPRPLTSWTNAPAVVRKALDAIKPSGGTAVYDAVLESMPLVAARSKVRAALLIISDGADTASTATLRETRSGLIRSDTFVYAIAIDSPEPQAINTRVNPAALTELTSETGGRTEIVRSSSDLVDATARIADELNHQYLIGYPTPHTRDGQYHSIRLRAGSYRVRARNGYYR